MSQPSAAQTVRPFSEGQTCPVCGQGQLCLHEAPFEYTYKGKHKQFPLQRFVCSACEEDFLDEHAIQAVEPNLRRWRREVDGLLQPEEIREIRRGLHVTQRQMAAVIGGGPKSFAMYETGVVNQSQAVDNILRMIRQHPRYFYHLARQRGIALDVKPIELLLVWKNPETRLRYVVGVLRKDRAGYRFRYETVLPRSLGEALMAGFRLLEAFPEAEQEYVASDLFPIFRSRLPEQEEAYEGLDLTSDQDMEFLWATGGRSTNDTLEFLEPIDESVESPEYRVTFPVAGWRYHGGESVIDELKEGTELRLELEPDNAADPNAVRILTSSGHKLGYVPAIYAWYIDESVERGEYHATVQRIGPKDDPQIRVVVGLSARLSTSRAVRVIPSAVKRYGELVTA